MTVDTVDTSVDSRPVLWPRHWDRWLLWGVAFLFDLALVMRLWDLGRHPFPVFDEVYFPNNAKDYLDGKTVFDAHPPLGKYFIVVSILLFGRNETGYRFVTAVFGALIPVLVAGVMYRLTYRRGLALLAGGLVITDGLFLVESRYGLMNQFLVAFGFAAQIFLLAGLERRGWQRFGLLSCSGLMLGAAAAVKWNGLWFAFMFGLLGVLVWAVAGYARLFWSLGGIMALLGLLKFTPLLAGVKVLGHPVWWILCLGLVTVAAICQWRPHWWSGYLPSLGILGEIRHLRWWHYALCFVFMPLLIYTVQWIPHLWLNPQGGIPVAHAPWVVFTKNFWQSFKLVHQAVLSVHTGSNLIVTDETPVHPYCSTSLRSLGQIWPILKEPLSKGIWASGAWSWPILGRPVGYFFKADGNTWTDVHGLGNPLLWWFSITAVVAMSVRGIRQFQAVPAYLLIGFAANFLPWLAVSRCIFIYHYLPSAAFAFMVLAFVVYGWLIHPRREWRFLGMSVVGAIILCQIYFLPIWLGLPLESAAFYARMWFRNQVPGLNWI